MRRRAPLLGLVILVGVVAVAAIALLALQPAEPTSGASASPAPLLPPAATRVAQAAPITGLEEAVWWRTGWRALHEDIIQPPDFGRLTIGRFEGEILGEVDIGEGWAARGAGPPFIVGPEMGLILYTSWEGRAAALHLVDGGALDDRVLVTRRGLYHAALAPLSGYAYYAAGAPEPGIWRVGLDGRSDPELVASPAEVAGLAADALLTAPISQLPKQVTLLLNETESRLAVFTCTDSCVLRVIELVTGEGFTIGVEAVPRELTDFVGNVVVIEGGAAFDAETEQPVPMPAGARDHVFHDVGWELPPGFSLEERPLKPGALPGATRYVLIDPDGHETAVDSMGQGPGQG